MDTAEIKSLVDEYDDVKQRRLATDRAAKELKGQETRLKEKITNELRESGLAAAGGSVLTVTLKPKDKPVAEDWPQLYVYIRSTDAFDLLHKRLTEAAVKARWEDSIQVPGVGKYIVYDLSESRVR